MVTIMVQMWYSIFTFLRLMIMMSNSRFKLWEKVNKRAMKSKERNRDDEPSDDEEAEVDSTEDIIAYDSLGNPIRSEAHYE